MKQTFNYYQGSEANIRKGFRIHLLAALLLMPAMWIIWLLTDPSYPWPVWTTISLTTGIVFHYLCVFVFRKTN